MPSGKSNDTKVVNTTTTNEPFQADELREGFGAAKGVLNTPKNYFAGGTVAPFSTQTQSALSGIEDKAMAGSPELGAASNQVMGTLGGEYLRGENPGYEAMVNRATRPVTRNFRENVMPGIKSEFAGSGRYGSGIARQNKEGQAIDDYLRTVGDVSGGLAYQNYGAERQNQQQAAQFAPQMAKAGYQDLASLMGVGGAYDTQAQAQLSDEVNRFNFGQDELANRIGDYMGLVGGGYGGTSTGSSTQPVQAYNPVLGALGMGAMGANITNSLFGGKNPVL